MQRAPFQPRSMKKRLSRLGQLWPFTDLGFVQWAVARGWVLWACAFALAVPALLRTASLYVHLKGDLEELLPRDAPSVLALRELRARMPAPRYLGVVVDVGSADNLSRGEAFLDALAQRINSHPVTVAASVRTGPNEERHFIERHMALY